MTPTAPTFDSVLIANRGEIAVRVIRTCQRLGLRTVAVYSDADRDALHVQLADAAVRIGPAPANQSYLVIENILAAAEQSGAQAIHPGYGFLSERAAFASAVRSAGLVFIGPDPAAIEAMGDKAAAKARMIVAGVPCVPGYQGADQSDETLAAEARKIGFPVMVKATAGGGGRGMRLVHDDASLLAALQSARSEAANAFGDGRLLIEQAVTAARHVEIQVFGDRHGNVVHLGERDCSVQRRAQKVIEESPSPAADDALRARMGAAAVAAAKAVDYVGAGTVEFLLAPDGAFHFLEMNTRLQVEHPVTEFVYGVDLVEWQLRVARGEAMPLSQQDILQQRHGWAIEARLCTEDPAHNFAPQTGRVLTWRFREDGEARVDHGLIEGQSIRPYYDSMQAKLIAFGPTREAARRKLLQLVQDTSLLGVASNLDFIAAILADEAFASGDYSTSLIPRRFPAETLAASRLPNAQHLALAALLLHETDARGLQRTAGFDASLRDWSSAGSLSAPLRLHWEEQDAIAIVQRPDGDAYAVRIERGGESSTLQLTLESIADGEARFRQDGARHRATWARDGVQLWLACDGLTLCYEDRTYAAAVSADAASDGQLRAPMDGRIVAIHTTPGASVRKGETLLVLEAMKMEFSLAAAFDGVVTELACTQGQQVKARQVLARIEPA